MGKRESFSACHNVHSIAWTGLLCTAMVVRRICAYCAATTVEGPRSGCGCSEILQLGKGIRSLCADGNVQSESWDERCMLSCLIRNYVHRRRVRNSHAKQNGRMQIK